MLHPSYSELMDKVNENSPKQNKINSRYSIVLMTSKRAREINDGAEVLVEIDDKKNNDIKPVSVAIAEIYAGKIKIKLT